jgi:hypothetical protein
MAAQQNIGDRRVRFDLTTVGTFLSIVFGSLPPDLWFLVWTLPDKISHWYQVADIENAVADISTFMGRDVYAGVGLSSADRGPHQRIEAASVSGLVGLWADVDVADRVHKKDGLPLDRGAARALIEALGPAPTIVVDSGHGLQAWWLFQEPWIFDTDEERREAARLSDVWNATLQCRARAMGYRVDATQDLSRVLRVPGTVNYKATPVPVALSR